MKPILFSVALFTFLNAYGQRLKDNKNFVDSTIASVIVRYDPEALRIPGNTIPIGITSVMKDGKVLETKGFLNGTLRWKKFRIDIQGGKFCFGKIRLDPSHSYMKNQYFTVNVYAKKSKKLLRSQPIAYNYETEVYVLEAGEYALAPGNRIKLGLRTFYDNEMHNDFWLSSSKSALKDYLLVSDGGHVSGGSLVINSDPFSISNHTVRLSAYLSKNPDIADTLMVLLDYIDDYRCFVYGGSGFSGTSGSTGGTGSNGSNGSDGYDGSRGHDLDVFVDAYFDTIIDAELMFVQVTDLRSEEIYNYLINTNGGTIDIISRGGSGGDGGSGGSGGRGADGAAGSYYTETIRVNDSTTTTITVQGPGGDGGNGGNGGNGGDGGNGGNGGNISINYTSYAEPYLDMITARSIGGCGGSGGSGGCGGSGGNGGQGNPTGRSGSHGSTGSSGSSGYSGSPGNVSYYSITPE